MAQALPNRKDVPLERQWAIESVFASVDDWEKAFAKLAPKVVPLKRFEGRLGESAATLLEATDEIAAWELELSPVGTYAMMLAAGDAGDPEAQAIGSRVSGLWAQFRSAIAFYKPELLAISADRLDEFYLTEPKLEHHRHHFAKKRSRRAHARSAEIELLLTQTSEFSTASSTYYALANADLKFADAVTLDGERLPVAQGTIASLVQHTDRAVRKAGWESYADGYLGVKNTMASCLVTSGQASLFRARARRHDSVLNAQLSIDQIPRPVFDNLLTTFRDHLPVWRRYWDVLRKGMGVNQLRGYDLPLYKSPATLVSERSRIPLARAVELICDAMAPMGERYVGPMRRGLTEDRWVDAWPNVGKGSGAFMGGGYGVRPFIMMNYDGDYLSLSTLAHELGHAMHAYLEWEKRPDINSYHSLFAAETASNFAQAMVRAHLLQTVMDRNERLQVLEEAIRTFHRYLFVMPMLAAFELDFYTKLETRQPVTPDGMSAKIVELFREGYGDAVTIDEDRLGIAWAQFTHLYQPYYTYQYATGISAANALARQVLTEGDPAADRCIAFLEAGGSLYPLDALKLAGIDMTSPDPIAAAFGALSEIIDELEALIV